MNSIKIGGTMVKQLMERFYISTEADYRADYEKYAHIVPDTTLENVREFKDKKSISEGFTAEKDDAFFIVFLSTNSKLDWLYNFLFFHKRIPYKGTNRGIKVHGGFISAYHLIREELHARYLASGKKKIFITGHSLGAALSTLCALDFQYNFNHESELSSISYGGPRIGNLAFKRSFNKRVPQHLRVTTGNEFTLKLPFAWLGFRHVGKEIHYGAPYSIWKWSASDHWPSNFLLEIFT